MAPRRNPDIVVAVLWEHGDQGANSAKLAAQVIETYVTKQRKAAGNIHVAETPAPLKPQDAPRLVTSIAPPRHSDSLSNSRMQP